MDIRSGIVALVAATLGCGARTGILLDGDNVPGNVGGSGPGALGEPDAAIASVSGTGIGTPDGGCLLTMGEIALDSGFPPAACTTNATMVCDDGTTYSVDCLCPEATCSCMESGRQFEHEVPFIRGCNQDCGGCNLGNQGCSDPPGIDPWVVTGRAFQSCGFPQPLQPPTSSL